MPRKRIILMYISKVSGHRSAAMAVEKAIRSIAPEADILSINAFKYTSPVWEKIVNYLYMHVIDKAPRIWDYLYDNPAVVKNLEKIKKVLHKFNSPKLKRLFDDFRPDVIACTQAYPCGMVADFKKFYKSSVPLVAVLTDYVPHSFWIYDTINYYVTPSEEVTSRMKEKGVDAQKIKPFGIPFDLKFNQSVNKEQVLEKLGFKAGVPTLLIMGGSHGLGPMQTIISSLEKSKFELQEIIVTGINRRLYCNLKNEIKNCRKRIKLFEYADNVHELMSISDILITKPGGITVAEALVKRIPLVIIKPIPGQEANNTAYLAEKEAAIKVDDLENIHAVVDDLLVDQKKLNLLKESAGRIRKPQAAMDIARLLLDIA